MQILWGRMTNWNFFNLNGFLDFGKEIQHRTFCFIFKQYFLLVDFAKRGYQFDFSFVQSVGQQFINFL